MSQGVRLEYANLRKMRECNTIPYRLAHWPIWIAVFFISPGPMTFDLFAYGGSRRTWVWLGTVTAGTGMAAALGRLPGAEPKPYILRFTEDRPNPLYRRICYTFAWNAALNFAVLNLAGLAQAAFTGRWRLKQIYQRAYFPLAFAIWGLGAAGKLPRVGPSTSGEGVERRYFYGTVWAACVAQPALGALWRTLPPTRTSAWIKLAAFVGALGGMAALAVNGRLYRTRRIVPGESIVAD